VVDVLGKIVAMILALKGDPDSDRDILVLERGSDTKDDGVATRGGSTPMLVR
jgi:hypothetical protein